jgi:hypothetical protein
VDVRTTRSTAGAAGGASSRSGAGWSGMERTADRSAPPRVGTVVWVVELVTPGGDRSTSYRHASSRELLDCVGEVVSAAHES